MAKGAQTTFRLPQELYDKLIKSAGTKHPIGEEIRRRLEASFEIAPADPKTQQLLAAIAFIAKSMSFDGYWHEDLNIFRIFKAALLALLSHFEPSGVPPDARYIMFDEADAPETVGRMYTGFALRDVLKEEE
jgi:hypothetical protein